MIRACSENAEHGGKEACRKRNHPETIYIYAQANPEITCDVNEGTASVLACASSHFIVRVGKWWRWDVARWKCGKGELWSEIGRNEKRNMEKRPLRWLDA
jgi:hypothetical protein